MFVVDSGDVTNDNIRINVFFLSSNMLINESQHYMSCIVHFLHIVYS